ncbi:response regulator [Antarcticirhabdus aurantiaca]|uniref:Response regulator n=1 Tax=Antarcticirhabdus aurantiaca TaxID=2606717 RepID=A0ACD4NXG7_9HYPH|nr:response regulator [Antarcticirhabdus aurantiaca]WAJ31604.1 response regulator [Jeongeuplla avenae]
MSTVPHIVVVDDHREIRDLLRQYLEQQGFRVSAAEDGKALRGILSQEKPDLLVLDIMMPGDDGLSLCRELRSNNAVPIIFLTAVADETDRIVGLEVGADDYLTKPFSARELLARIKAVLRRVNAPPRSDEPVPSQRVRFAQWTLDLQRRELQDAKGIAVSLSTGEFRLLRVFVERPGVVLTRDQLLDLTTGRGAEPFDRSVDNQVSRLRKKIEVDPRNPAVLQTEWGGGYRFAAVVSRA